MSAKDKQKKIIDHAMAQLDFTHREQLEDVGDRCWAGGKAELLIDSAIDIGKCQRQAQAVYDYLVKRGCNKFNEHSYFGAADVQPLVDAFRQELRDIELCHSRPRAKLAELRKAHAAALDDYKSLAAKSTARWRDAVNLQDLITQLLIDHPSIDQSDRT